jgi:hypothetical protein
MEHSEYLLELVESMVLVQKMVRLTMLAMMKVMEKAPQMVWK